MRKIKFIVIHHNGVPGRDIENIRRSHKNRGFYDVGYHYVITENGTIQRGRPEHKSGAHAKGLNTNSIGICMIGNGNKAVFTDEQMDALYWKLWELIEAYPDVKIIGHREVNAYVAKKNWTKKTCPGKLIDMDDIREHVLSVL